MINRKLLISASIVGVLVIIAIAAYRLFFAAYTTDPPVVVVGGSITTTFPRGWVEDVPNVQYHGLTTNDSAIYTDQVYDQSNVLVPQPIPVTGGFVIKFYDSDPSGNNPRGDAGLELCSSQNCDPGKADPGTVYLKVLRPGDQLEKRSSRELHFHSLGLNGQCDSPGSSNEGPCDHINHLGILIGSPTETTDYCQGHGQTPWYCKIAIGRAP